MLSRISRSRASLTRHVRVSNVRFFASQGMPATSASNGIPNKRVPRYVEAHKANPNTVSRIPHQPMHSEVSGSNGGRMRTSKINKVMQHPEEGAVYSAAQDRLEHTTKAHNKERDVSGREASLLKEDTLGNAMKKGEFDFPAFSKAKESPKAEASDSSVKEGRKDVSKMKMVLHDSIADKTDSILSTASSGLHKVGDAISSTASTGMHKVGAAAEKAAEAVHAPSLQQTVAVIGSMTKAAATGAAMAATNVVQGISSTVQQARETASAAQEEMEGKSPEQLLEASKKELTGAKRELSAGFSEAIHTVRAKREGFLETTKNSMGALMERMPNAFQKLVRSYVLATPLRRNQHEELVRKHPHWYGYDYVASESNNSKSVSDSAAAEMK